MFYAEIKTHVTLTKIGNIAILRVDSEQEMISRNTM